jgi:uncharacterized protein (TIGR02996 family)
MMNDADFLTAIQAAPHDAAPRLIYADWLEERGDVRAELIRVEEEMRRLPVFADRYWQLKPRGKALRALAASDWMEALSYGRWRPIFAHGIPVEWKERWRLIREFTEVWHGTHMSDVGGRADEVQQAEARLGRTLPPSVREWVAFAQDVLREENWVEELRGNYQMMDLIGHPALSLLLHYEECDHWAVRHEDLTLADPPVYSYYFDPPETDEPEYIPGLEYFRPDEERNPRAHSVSEFVLEFVMKFLRGEGGWTNTIVADSSRLLRDLEATFPHRAELNHIRIYEMENVMVQLQMMSGEESVLQVDWLRDMQREALPACLLDHLP